MISMFIELLSHCAHGNLKQQNEKEKLSKFDFTTSISINYFKRFWLESFEVFFRISISGVAKGCYCLVKVTIGHGKLARLVAIFSEYLEDFFWRTEESNFVFVQTTHLFGAIYFFAFTWFILLACLIKIHQSKRS